MGKEILSTDLVTLEVTSARNATVALVTTELPANVTEKYLRDKKELEKLKTAMVAFLKRL